MYDWDGNGRVDPYDIGQSVNMGLYDENEERGLRKKQTNGCLTMMIIIASAITTFLLI